MGRLCQEAVRPHDPARIAGQLVKPEQGKPAPERLAREPCGERTRSELIVGENVMRQRPKPHVRGLGLPHRFKARWQISAHADSARLFEC